MSQYRELQNRWVDAYATVGIASVLAPPGESTARR
jgi:hypothetical protein